MTAEQRKRTDDSWLLQPSAQRSRWILDQRNAHSSYVKRNLTEASRFARLYDRFDTGRDGAPQFAEGRMLWVRRQRFDEVRRLVVRMPGGAERTVVDPSAEDPRHTTLIDDFALSPDGRLVAVWMSTRGQEDRTLTIRDVATGAIVEGPRDDISPQTFAWTPASDGYYCDIYAGGSGQIFRHDLGTDRWAFITTVPNRHVAASLALAPDGGSIVFTEWEGDWTRQNTYLVATRPGSSPVPLHEGVEGVSEPLWLDGDLHLVTTVGSDRGRLVKVDPAKPGRRQWDEVIAPSHSRIRSVVEAGGKLYVASSYEGADRVTVHGRDGEILGRLSLPGRGEVSGLSADAGAVFFTYSDIRTPEEVMRFDTQSGALQVVAAPADPGLSDDVVTVSTLYPSADGTLVPIDITYRRDAGLDGPRPALLHAYGGFLIDDPPAYSPDIAAWVSAGGVYATAHVRGGDIRSGWHRNGPEGKAATVEDMAAAARFLSAEGWTTPRQLGLIGGSNGGWLVAQTAMKHPELMGAAVPQCAVLDMVGFAKFGPGRSWVREYGDAEDLTQRKGLRANSPLHSVRKGATYPPMLFTVGDDPRVSTPGHTFRMVEALQKANPKGTYLIRYDRNVGHGYGSRSRTRAELSEVLAFFAHHLGLGVSERVVRGVPGREVA